jgi:hypothetical protein
MPAIAVIGAVAAVAHAAVEIAGAVAGQPGVLDTSAEAAANRRAQADQAEANRLAKVKSDRNSLIAQGWATAEATSATAAQNKAIVQAATMEAQAAAQTRRTIWIIGGGVGVLLLFVVLKK